MLHYTTLHYTYFSHYSDCCQKETKQCAHLRSKAAQLDESNMEFSLLKRLSQQYTQIIYGPLLPQMNPKDVNYTKLLLLESTILLSTVC